MTETSIKKICDICGKEMKGEFGYLKSKFTVRDYLGNGCANGGVDFKDVCDSWVSKYKRQNGELTDKVKELEAQIEKMKCLLNEIYSEYGFSELVKIRNNLPIEIQEVIK